MAFFYDSSSDREEDGLPIILAPDRPSLSKAAQHSNTMKVTASSVQVPTHPIASMQGAFAESMFEASGSADAPKKAIGDATARRKRLLDQGASEATKVSTWQQRPDQSFHQLWKLMAQVSFGIYLLLKGIAKDDNQVMDILQGHVNEVDEFLECTLEDFQLAQEDIDERLKFLQLPLENVQIFESMLEDRQFRLQIVAGNERIEHVIARTAYAMDDALRGVQQGLAACKEFAIYLAQEQRDASWRAIRSDMDKVFDAMKGNVEGWSRAYISLQAKGKLLGTSLVNLSSAVEEMDKRAGEVSRKKRFDDSSPASPKSMSPKGPRQLRQPASESASTDRSGTKPASDAPVPAFRPAQDHTRSPVLDLEPESESEAEPQFTLKPHTYSPVLQPRTYSPAPSSRPRQMQAKPVSQVPSPYENQQTPASRSPVPRQAQVKPVSQLPVPRRSPVETPPEVRQKSTARQTRRKNSSPEPVRPTVVEQREIPPTSHGHYSPNSPDEGYWEPPKQTSSRARNNTTSANERNDYLSSPSVVLSSSRPRAETLQPQSPHSSSNSALNTSSSQGQDSAYCSDPDPWSHPHPLYANRPPQSPSAASAPLSRPLRPITPSSLSPRSDQQFFRPVQVNPHSPLQRPWTAAPAEPSALRNGRTLAPSRMGESMMSDMTMVTMPDGKKLKKKRSAFGWLKKAFSLSDEERAAFEEKRRAPVVATGRDEWRERERPVTRQHLEARRLRS